MVDRSECSGPKRKSPDVAFGGEQREPGRANGVIRVVTGLSEKRIMRLRIVLMSCLACGWIGPAAVAKELPKQFTLGRYIPQDVWLYYHGVHNPERDWLDAQWGEVFDALSRSGIDRDIKSLVLASASPEDRAGIESAIDKAIALIKGVAWSDLFKHEVVFVERFVPSQIGPEYVLLTRGVKSTVDANVMGLAAILTQVASLSDNVSLTQSKNHGADVWSMRFGAPCLKKAGYSLSLFRKGDLIGLVVGGKTLTEVLELVAGGGSGGNLVSSPRFQKAIAEVKSPRDSIMFFDVKTFLSSMCNLFDTAAAKHKEGKKEDPALCAIRSAVEMLDILDYVVVTTETKGRRKLEHSLRRFRPGKENSPVARAFLNRKPFERFDKYIPADATGFNVSGLVDPEGSYKIVLEFIEKNVPEGSDAIAHWKSLLASVDFDPQRDIFDWLSGEMISIDMPPAVVTPMGGGDKVWMFRVKNGALASRKVNAAIDFINAKLQAEGQMLLVSPAQVRAEGFREVTHPLAAMFMRPVIGVTGDWLMIGTSASAINKCLDVAAGEAPSIRTNARFKEEGIIPDGAVQGASFSDTSKLGQELGQAVGMIGMVGGMMSAGINGEGAAEKKQMLQKLMSIVMKLGPVLQKLDFYSSSSSVCTYDGKSSVLTEAVVTYKEPSPSAPKTAKAAPRH